jgi:hypothetical protein
VIFNIGQSIRFVSGDHQVPSSCISFGGTNGRPVSIVLIQNFRKSV